ncbi:hypothetical protein X766_21760 [Mesorhizobium sp. LSJC255A00]|nr:hypothetical protein X766_21760 [Mesorhizobium sp. LSJC255A00]
MLIGTKPQSPGWLRLKIDNPVSPGSQDMELSLYDDGGPKWIEGDREAGVDLAVIRLSDKPRFPLPFSQTFAPNSASQLAPGLDVVMIGHPFELGLHARSAIWKGAMVASDRDAPRSGRPWILIDAPGVPGMSGSPVYRRSYRSSKGAEERSFESVSSSNLATTSSDLMDDQLELELVGVYAGAVGDEILERLKLGRVFPVDLIEELLRNRKQGSNPFPPVAFG